MGFLSHTVNHKRAATSGIDVCSNRRYVVVFVLLFIMGGAGQIAVRAQDRTGATGLGGQIQLMNSGLGIGGYWSRLIATDVTLVAELSVSSIRDGREVTFFNRLGGRETPDKANYLLQVPLQIGIERRLFRERIEDQFRPFAGVTTGPTLLWTSPYFDDENQNGSLDGGETVYGSLYSIPKGSPSLGWTATVSIGAHFGGLAGPVQSLRFGYVVTWFFDDIALLVPSVKDPVGSVGSPTIRLSFGRLY